MLVFLQSLVDTNCSEIASIEQQIAALQERIKSLQTHNQALGSVDGAIDSMFVQIGTAFKMVASVCPEQVERLKEAVNDRIESVFSRSDVPPALPDNPDASESDVDDGADVDGTIDAEVLDADVSEPDSIDPAPQPEPHYENGNGNLSRDDLDRRFDRNALMKLAKGRVEGKLNRMGKDDLTDALAGKLSPEDIALVLGSSIDSSGDS